ncbi:hypothetical protein VTJ49DRAFT_819 [Mycothermus thermophilus]|uniref:GPI inositol-deacylase n=1 Tax=Humicola insolens TaxID=85995 RepID=A0ABR3VDZ2_HUMIN
MAYHSQTWEPTTTPSAIDTDRLLVPRTPTSIDRDRPSSPSGIRGRLQNLRRGTSPSRSKSSQSLDGSSKGPLGLSLLHEPSEPRVDFVFVHGLGGGSRRSWSASSDPATFWPKEWLPSEPGFKHVRIHSFGYDSDWTKSERSTLTIHDFGQALLADLYNSPNLKKNGNTPIVLVAHSMGGLVVKKAYLIARRDPIYEEIASRIHSLYFLGTPHRGADSSAVVTTLISMSIGNGSKAFLKELIPGSGTLQAINDEFRHVCKDIGLWSFFEGLPTSTGPTSTIIVEKESAIMGLPGEHTQYLQADHRRLVKFESPDDPNYNILLRCFNTTIEEIEKDSTANRFENHRLQMKRIAQAFDVTERPDGDCLRALDKLHTGSCEWLTSSASFQSWLQCEVEDPNQPIKAITSNSHSATPRFLWLSGPPGSGKSVASGHVIRYLESVNLDCAYFFFKNNEKQSITQFLLSMALQMADSNFQIRHTFLAMIDEGEVIDSHVDHAMVWNNIFLGRIFRIALSQPQYWVIDALDECPTRLLATLVSMFSRIDPSVPLRIFITSRPSGHVERLLNQERIPRVEMRTGQADSLRDIEAFVRSRLSPSMIQEFNEAEGDLVAEIISRSNGIFLWASLIMDRLDEAHSIEAMRSTLSQVPTEMSGMYRKILESIVESPNADLAHCILKWVVTVRKPLTTEELREAVRLDINQTLRASDRFAQICGNLITVHDNRVQVMHQTVKEFLTGPESDYYIPRSWSHARIAELCLNHLNSRNFNPPRSRRGPSLPPADPTTNTAFDTYATTNFSYHLSHSSPSTSTLHLLPLLSTFFSSNVLTWLDRVASTGRLSLLTHTVQNLKAYLTKQVVTSSPLDADYQLATRFVEDLARLSAVYGQNLLDFPASVYTLIPLLCPRSSVVHWKFGKQFPRQKVLGGEFNRDWDERLSSFTFPARVMAAACAEQIFAVGLGDGTVRVYRQGTFELVNVLEHGEAVRKLAMGNMSGVVVSAGLRVVKVWGGKRQALLWEVEVEDHPLSVRFGVDDERVYVPLRSGEVCVFRTRDGARMDGLDVFGEESSDSDSDGGVSGEQMPKRTVPMLIRISPGLGLAAIAYRSSHLQISYYDSDERVQTFEKAGYESTGGGGIPPQILDVAFSEAAAADHGLMAVAYQDGDVITLDPWTLEQRHAVHINAHVLAASPDGQTLAAGDSEFGISLFAFDGLRLLCRIESLEEHVQGLVFAPNSLRLFDLRGNTCNVWEPPVLIKKNLADDTSSEDADEYLIPAASNNLIRTSRSTSEATKAITAVAQADDTNYVFCGREEGSITAHDIATGAICGEFQFHARMVDISHVEWNAQASVLLSVDASRRCIVTKFSLPPPTSSMAVQKPQQQRQVQPLDQIADFRASDTVLQALISPDASAVLIATPSGAELHVLNPQDNSDGTTQSKHTITNMDPASHWLPHPTNPSQLLLVTAHSRALHLFRWTDLGRETPEEGIRISLPQDILTAAAATDGTPEQLVSSEWHARPNLNTLVQTVDLGDGKTGFLTLDISAVTAETESVEVQCVARRLGPAPSAAPSQVKNVLGIHRSNLYFVSGRGWVCSVSLKTLAGSSSSRAGCYVRHFFIPSVWQTGGGGSGELLARVLSKTTMAMAHRDELVVLQGFLEFEHKTEFAGEGEERAVVPVIRMS